ncbi:MAG: hypothetical protein JSU90_12425 [Nitrospiraceae bacterium]|nr:MAG: hypothetical protein JSU90_12425 [Nitrospiraceae bacterium]
MNGNEAGSSRWVRVLSITAICLSVIAISIAIWVKFNIYASFFKPTQLSAREQKALDSKLSLLMESQNRKPPAESPYYEPEGPVKPEPYSEKGAKREISLTEKELNAIIANNPEVARKVAIDLSDNLVSVKLVIPVDEDVIILGGKTLRISLGIMLGYEKDKPLVGIRGVSLGGIPLPNAWLGYMKDRNLVEEFGTESGFWKLLADGVQDLRVKDGHILIRLKE